MFGKIIWAGFNSLYRPWELKENGMKEVEIVGNIIKKLKFYSAGSDFMYFAVSSELRNSHITVSLVYRGYWFYWLLFFFSIMETIFVVEEIIINGALSQRIAKSIGKLVKKENLSWRINSWWKKGEE